MSLFVTLPLIMMYKLLHVHRGKMCGSCPRILALIKAEAVGWPSPWSAPPSEGISRILPETFCLMEEKAFPMQGHCGGKSLLIYQAVEYIVQHIAHRRKFQEPYSRMPKPEWIFGIIFRKLCMLEIPGMIAIMPSATQLFIGHNYVTGTCPAKTIIDHQGKEE